ncbi:unnamed protein product (macronuclear) [Paramecium tetraurelia]|uniref:Uncharacterized protein n=1 Tax=Paramecium tetraurelia TaxID=5888 RepID=A0DPA3_PARTE|nr:uncharacterized protein GSPATT00019052001 [Paramecium tetraurelia]CAK84870.1 unnamed protein product [Paramecium tetraurelia]|eukprot:XP_001452267.1 hypothetical protein (macronuclear) [Paramecium tetraurelia strain d4-2]
MSDTPQINIIANDCVSINQMKREKFRMDIRKNKLESLFRQNRGIHRLGDSKLPSNLNILDSLQEFLKSDALETLNQFCNLIDSKDLFEAYYEVSQFIIDIKYYLIQPLNHQSHFNKMLQLLKNCIIVNPKIVKTILSDEKDKIDLALLFQLMKILQSTEWKSLHVDALNTLNLLIEQESQLLDIIQQEKLLLEQIVYQAFDLPSDDYLLALTEFLSLYLQSKRELKFQDQFNVTQDILNRAIQTKDLQIIYGSVLLANCLSEQEFTFFQQIYAISDIIVEYLEQDLSQFEYIVIFKTLRICIKKMSELLFPLIGKNNIIEVLYNLAFKLEKQAGKDLLKLISCYYKTYTNLHCLIEDQILYKYVQKSLMEYLDKFVDFYAQSNFAFLYKIKVLDKLINCQKHIQFRLQEQQQFNPEPYIKFFGVVEQALDQVNIKVEQILYLIEALSNVLQIEDMHYQTEVLKLIPNQLYDQLNNLSMHENERVSQETTNLIVLLQFC